VDNYGDVETNELVASFQFHHDKPWMITRGELATVVEGPAIFVSPLMVLALVAFGPIGQCFVASFCFWAVVAQLAHTWSHERSNRLPPLVNWLQAAGVLIRPKEHRVHHGTPVASHYCLLSGIWNKPLDSGVVYALECLIYRRTGVAPRSWAAG